MIADEIDDLEAGFALGGAQAAAELLQEDDLGIRGSQHDDAVDRGNIEALIEEVDHAECAELA